MMRDTYLAMLALLMMGFVVLAMNEAIMRWDKRREERKRRSGGAS